MNIYDIAKLAGVSIATVSRVVNDSPKVSGKTKARVRAVMAEQNYTPNVFARGLGLNSMNTVGIICPDVADAYMANAVAYLEKNLKAYGYDCILYCSGYEQKDKEQAVRNIMQKRVDALLFVGSNYAGDEEYGEDISYIIKASEEIPVFILNGYVKGQNIYCVLADDYQVFYKVTDAMIQAGRKRILFLSDTYSYSAMQKQKGYEDALKANDLPVLGELKLRTQNKIHLVRDLLLARKDLDFDGVMATEDGLAIGVVKYAKARQLQIPKDISIVGFNNTEMAIGCEPELTSIDGRGEILCKTAIDSLMMLLSGEKIKHKKHVSCRLLKRCTTDF